MASNGEFIEVLSPSALKDLQALNAEIVKTIAGVKTVNENMINIKSPSGADSAIKSLTADYDKNAKAIANVQIQLEKLAQAQNRTKISNNAVEKSNLSLEASIERKNKAFDREQQKLAAAQNLYNKTQKQINVLTQAYNDLMIRKLRYDNLNENEEKRLLTLQKVTERYNTTLKAVDATVGKHSRNVGNYASTFNPLSNSINQLTREMPAFTYSVQTGFMALSNNIPIFTDAISNAVAQNKLLQAEGKPTTSVLKQLAGAFLSWQTLLGVGITLLTVYGKEIGVFINELFNADSALKELNASQKEYNSAKLTGRKDAQSEILELRKYLSVLNDKKLSDEQRKIAQDAILKQYPYYIRSVKDAMIVDGQYSKGVNDLITALEKRKEVEKKSELNVINKQKLIDLDSEAKAQQKLIDKAKKLYDIESSKPIIVDRATAQANRNKLGIAEESLNRAKEKGISIQKQINAFTNQSIKNDTDIIKLKKETIGLEYQEERVVKIKKEKNKEIEKEVQLQEYLSKLDFENAFKFLEEQINSTSILNEDYEGLVKTLNSIKKTYEELYGTIKKGEEESGGFILLTDEQVFYDTINEAERTAQAMKALEKATEDWLKQLNSDAFNQAFDNIGLSSAKMFFDFDEYGMSTFDKLFKGADTLGEKFAVTFQAIGDVAQEVFNRITEMQNARFENAFNNLEREKEIAIAFAGESTSAREEIERQYEQRRKEIEKQKAKAQKETAIFNIIIDTAQAVVTSLAEGNYGQAILFSTLGSVQLAIVASQPIPEYWQGTDNAKEGFAWTQEKGAEIITDKNGNVKTLGSNKGAQLTKMDKGDKVYTASQSALMFNDNLNSMLFNNGISMPKVEINNNSALTESQVNSIINAIKNKSEAFINIDENGFDKKIRNGHTTKEMMNKRFNFQGNKE